MSHVIASTYEITEKIGSGGGGIVYKANHLRLDKPVVLKADKRTLKTNQDALRREVDALKHLSHTYIPQVYDYFVDGDTVYTVMDFIAGESLDKPLKRGVRFTQPQIIEWACQLLEALAYLHNPVHGNPPKTIVHSDIKPANIMVTPRGEIRLIDFNIALALGESNVAGRSEGYASPEHYGLDFSTDHVKSGERTELSTTELLAPTEKLLPERTEIVQDENNGRRSSGANPVIPDTRSDIYSLGATLYHLLTGQVPAKDARMVIPILDWKSKAGIEISPSVGAIIQKAMDPNPDLRYQSAVEMLAALEHLRKADPRWQKLKRRLFQAGALCTIAFAAGAFLAFAGLKQMEQTQSAYALAGYAQRALAEGNPVLAVDYALQALPEKTSIFTPPYTAQAQKALADALGVYDLADGFKHHAVVNLPSEALKVELSPDGQTGAAVYAYGVAVFDVETGTVLAELPAVYSALADVVFSGQILLYAGEDGICAYDTVSGRELWAGRPATEIAVSADGGTVAAVYKDEAYAVIYDMSGKEKQVLDFSGRRQWTPVNDSFGNPEDNLFALNDDGSLLAVSFDGGALSAFDLRDGEEYEFLDESDYFHFEGGFYQQYFAFSMTSETESLFLVYDMEDLVQTGGFLLDSRLGVQADPQGIFLSFKNIVVKIDPLTGEQEEAAYTNSDVRSFHKDTEYAIVATANNDYVLFDQSANALDAYENNGVTCDFVKLAGDFALAASRDTSQIHILRQVSHLEANLLQYNGNYRHSEARISEDESRYMLFSVDGLRLYDGDGSLLCEVEIPDSAKIHDQQYSKASGNLAVIYPDTLLIYSGQDGALIFEKRGLKSVFYAPYGVSILERDGTLQLISLDSGEALVNVQAEGEFGAYCEMIVDDTFLAGQKLAGAARVGEDCVFAVAGDGVCAIYSQNGKEKFVLPAEEQTEVFFTDNAVVLSPLHGTPAAYSLKNGRLIAELESDAYLTYVSRTERHVVTQYITAEGRCYGILLDPYSYQPLAYLPDLTDVTDNTLYFDLHGRVLRKTNIFSIDELISLARGGE